MAILSFRTVLKNKVFRNKPTQGGKGTLQGNLKLLEQIEGHWKMKTHPWD